jgi:hypothetical protein
MSALRRLSCLPARLPLAQLRRLAATMAPTASRRFVAAPNRAFQGFARVQQMFFSSVAESKVIGTTNWDYPHLWI